jgi:hypothetical protein
VILITLALVCGLGELQQAVQYVNLRYAIYLLLTILAERQAAPYLYLDIQQEARQSYGSETIEVVWGCGCGNRAYHFYVSNT